MSEQSSDDIAVAVPVALREPAHQVSPRAVPFWRLSAALTTVFFGAWLIAGMVLLSYLDGAQTVGRWALGLGAVVVALLLARTIWMPPLRFRIHRWEVSPGAIHTRSGWLGREERIAPLSRVQTVDSRQGALMRYFKLSTITVTTASAAGPIEIECLDEVVARQVVAELTEIVESTTGDAT